MEDPFAMPHQINTIAEPLPTLIVWELIVDYWYRFRYSRTIFIMIDRGITVADFFFEISYNDRYRYQSRLSFFFFFRIGLE